MDGVADPGPARGSTLAPAEQDARAAPSGPPRAERSPPAPSGEPDLERLREIEQITDLTLGYLSLEEALNELLERVQVGMHVDTVAVLLLDEDRGVLLARAARGIEEEVRQGIQVPLARGFAGRVAAEARPVIIEDLERANVVNPLLRQKGIRSLLGVPLRVEGHVIGVLHIGTLTHRRFDDGDVRLLQLAADRVALVIDNARLSEQRAVTELMQRTLLPDALPEIPGLRFSAKYLPAGAGVKIGGDWYDVFTMPDGRVALVIGDVVGRGVLAAAVMAEIRTALRAYLMEGHDVGEAMELLNELVASMTGPGRSATAAVFALDLDRERLCGVSAGHPPALLAEPDGSVTFLETPPALPLGTQAGEAYAAMERAFPVGAALVLYTDGLVEQHGKTIDEGLERLMDATANAQPGADGLAGSLFRAMVPSESLDDDLALIAIESVALGPRIELTIEASPRSLAPMRRMLGRWLGRHGVDAEASFDITVATSEAAGNAIEHAYGPHPASFVLSCERTPTDVRIAVRDTGSWRPARAHVDARGRGLTIMHQLMDSVAVEQGAAGTTVRLVKRVTDVR